MRGDVLNLWSSLPVPGILIDPDDCIVSINSAAEGFFNTSDKAMHGTPVWDAVAIDAPIEESFARARKQGTPLFVNCLLYTSPSPRDRTRSRMPSSA